MCAGTNPCEVFTFKQERGLDTYREDAEESQEAEISLHQRTIQMALMGRPNVGKSSLLNAILRDERVITGPTPGLTRFFPYLRFKYL